MNRVLDINVRGVFVGTQAALKHMPDGGRIISIGSCVGERNMTPGLTAYAATKGAVKMFTQGLAREVGRRDYGEQRTAGADRHGLEPCLGRLGGPAVGQHCSESLRKRRGGGNPGGLRSRPRGSLYYGRQPDGGRWNQRLRLCARAKKADCGTIALRLEPGLSRLVRLVRTFCAPAVPCSRGVSP